MAISTVPNVRKLNRFLQDFCKKYYGETCYFFCDPIEGFKCNYYENGCFSISYTFAQEESDDEFMARLKREGLKNNDIPVFIVSLCHEIGHLRTMNKVSQDLNLYYRTLDYNENNITLDEYWDFPIEKAANAWAVRFLNNSNHTKFIIKLVKLINNCLHATDEIDFLYCGMAEYVD